MERKFYVLVLALLASGLAAADWNLGTTWTAVDNFESYSTGVIGTAGVASPPWNVNDSQAEPPGNPSAQAIGQELNGNKYLLSEMALGTSTNETYGVNRALPTAIPLTDTSTSLFLRFQAPNPANANNSFGLTSSITPSAANFGDFRVQFACRNGDFEVRNGSSWVTKAYTANTWYDVWAVINTSISKFDVYMKAEDGSGPVPADLMAAGINFRTPATASLSFFDVMVQGPATGTAITDLNNNKVLLDNIYISIPEPASMLLLGLGGLVMSFRRK
jgi:hypothetical protein